MRIWWCFLHVTLIVSAMDAPLMMQPELRKYSCCPDKFGYRFIKMDDNIASRRLVYFCDFEETRVCDGEILSREVYNPVFKRLMFELSCRNTFEARESFEQLVERLRTGRIQINANYTKLSNKDLLHRLLAHLPACLDDDADNEIKILLGDEYIKLSFIGYLEMTCIHNCNSKVTVCFEGGRQYKFDDLEPSVNQAFSALKPFPSLTSLAAQALSAQDKQRALAVLPQDLHSLLH